MRIQSVWAQLALTVLTSLACAGQQGAKGAGVDPSSQPSPAMTIEDARAALAKAEAEHPGNTLEVAGALDQLIETEANAEKVDEESLKEAEREAAVAEAAAGQQSEAYVTALVNTSKVYALLSRVAEGRPIAERAVAIAQERFPGTALLSDAANALADLCFTLGDRSCGLTEYSVAVDAGRAAGAGHELSLATALSGRAALRDLTNDSAGAGSDLEEAIVVAQRGRLDELNMGILESNTATHYIRTQEFAKSILHYKRALELVRAVEGPDSPFVAGIEGNLGEMYTRTGQFSLAWPGFEAAVANPHVSPNDRAWYHGAYGRSLAGGGELQHAIQEGLMAAKMGRETFVLEARTLPERQALAYDKNRPVGLEVALSILARHPEISANDTYQEVVRSRALVADEMARRQRNLNADNDPEVGRLLEELSNARASLLDLEGAPGKEGDQEAIAGATQRMESIERSLAEHSAMVRDDRMAAAASLEDVRRGLPPGSALVSYFVYKRVAVEEVDPARTRTPSYIAFVLRADSERIHVFDLGEVKPIDDLVTRERASADAEAHSGGLSSTRNERTYREAGEALRKQIWDPLRSELAGAKLAIVVPDGMLDLIPFAGLPDGNGYLVEHGPAIHMLSSERDLISSARAWSRKGLLAIGNPTFDLATNRLPAPGAQRLALLRDAPVPCDTFRKLEFDPLPGTASEVIGIRSTWQRWNHGEPLTLVTGDEATRARFLDEIAHSRVLHVATHAFLLDSACGDGNPLLHSGLVFAGANKNRDVSILTAQQIASLDLNGVDLAVLSACNTGGGELTDGEGVLGLERAFHIAGARSVVMSLWPVDDAITSRYMRTFYVQLLAHKAQPADAVWSADRTMLLARRSAGLSTHPWYWAGFVASGWQ